MFLALNTNYQLVVSWQKWIGTVKMKQLNIQENDNIFQIIVQIKVLMHGTVVNQALPSLYWNYTYWNFTKWKSGCLII